MENSQTKKLICTQIALPTTSNSNFVTPFTLPLHMPGRPPRRREQNKEHYSRTQENKLWHAPTLDLDYDPLSTANEQLFAELWIPAGHGTFNAATRPVVRHPPENRHAAAHGQQFLFAIASRSPRNIVRPRHYTPYTTCTLFSPHASENRAK